MQNIIIIGTKRLLQLNISIFYIDLCYKFFSLRRLTKFNRFFLFFFKYFRDFAQAGFCPITGLINNVWFDVNIMTLIKKNSKKRGPRLLISENSFPEYYIRLD